MINRSNSTILIAEDDLIFRKSVVAHLKNKGFEVLEANDGVEAYTLFKTNNPDLILTDLIMPNMGGFELLQKVRNENQDAGVIILSGLGTKEDVVEALRAGAWDYISKPINDMEFLYHTIETNLEKVRLNSAVKNHQELLEKTIQDKNEELKKKIEEHKAAQAKLLQAQKLESVGQLASGIAHEINTPTQYIGSNIQFLQEAFEDIASLIKKFHELLRAVKKEEIPATLVEEVEDLVKELDWEYLEEEIPETIGQSQDGVRRVTSIVRAMKEFSHPGSKEKEPADLNHIIKTTITVSQNEWKYIANVELDLDPELPPVPLLTDEMGQVFLNLLVNATHAIEAKIGENPEGEKGIIAISTSHEGDWIEARVADDGSGIPEDAREKIFDPFFTTKKIGKGTGQGLAISHDVVTQKHDGEITFETESGKGTTFIIKIPVQ
jgi:signal transduction histidine kinase